MSKALSNKTLLNNISTLNTYSEYFATISLVPTSGTITLSEKVLNYTRIGNRVFLSGRVFVSGVSSPTGDLTIQGLPFTAFNASGAYSALSVWAGGMLATTPHSVVQANIPANTNYMYIRGYLNGAEVITMANNIQAGSYLIIGGSYQV